MMKIGRATIVGVAAVSLAAISTAASAQYGDPAYCGRVARVVCSNSEEGLTIECYEREFELCMSLGGSALDAYVREQ